jgi:alpha-L-fucosidase 2
MKPPILHFIVFACLNAFCGGIVFSATPPAEFFSAPTRGFISLNQPKDWQQAIFTGNGTMGAMVMGNPYDETLYLSHAALYLPNPDSPNYIDMASHLAEIRKLCLDGNFRAAGELINVARKESNYQDHRDPFIAAFNLRIRQSQATVTRYQRSVDYMTAETFISVEDDKGSFRRSTFISRPDDVIVTRLAGSGKQSAEFAFEALPPANANQQQTIAKALKSSEQGVKDGFLYFRNIFAIQNQFNPNLGYEGVGKIIAKGGTRTESATGIRITNADEILVLIKIRPLAKSGGGDSNAATLEQELNALPNDYATLLTPHAKMHGDMMGRVSLSLDAPAADRAKPTEQLNQESLTLDAPLAKIERAFDAGRYNIICCTGFYPPNLQGLWSGTWSAPWSGSFTTNGNLPTAVAFLLMGNTPELMQAYFHYYDERIPGFRENTKVLYGMRGFHVPAQLTVSPYETDFSPSYPHSYWHTGAPWACEFYYDYYRYTGDEKFLAERAYPMMKEAAAFYEDFLTVTDKDGKLVFVPTFSAENAPSMERGTPTSINATMEVAAAKQLLHNAIAAAKHLNRDADLQIKWANIIAKLPDYQVGPDGSFREWLWPGLDENNSHRHASHLYALYDEMPAEIVDNPDFVHAIEHTVVERLKFREKNTGMAFGVVQLGLASAHIGNAELAQQTINILAKGYWSSGMGSFHNWENLFNMDISGGFPYLCASTLVYSEPGTIRFFPARPPQWTRGSLKGVRLRGGIILRDLTWDGPKAKAKLVSDSDQTITTVLPGAATKQCKLTAGVASDIEW